MEEVREVMVPQRAQRSVVSQLRVRDRGFLMKTTHTIYVCMYVCICQASLSCIHTSICTFRLLITLESKASPMEILMNYYIHSVIISISGW